MNYGAAAPAYRPTAWAYLPSGDCTIRWQRGDNVAYIFQGKQLETYPDQGLRVETLATIPVSPKGWADIPHVQRLGEAWV
jgi:hypothetical protein